MDDLKLAKKILKKQNINLAIVKKGKLIFKSNLKGIKGLLKAIEELEGQARGSSAADRIIGRAAALLLAYLETEKVFGITVSEGGKEILEKYKIDFKTEKVVPRIKNQNSSDICPFEKLTREIENPEEAYRKIKSKIST